MRYSIHIKAHFSRTVEASDAETAIAGVYGDVKKLTDAWNGEAFTSENWRCDIVKDSGKKISRYDSSFSWVMIFALIIPVFAYSLAVVRYRDWITIHEISIVVMVAFYYGFYFIVFVIWVSRDIIALRRESKKVHTLTEKRVS